MPWSSLAWSRRSLRENSASSTGLTVPAPYLWTAVAIVSVTLGEEVISLIYSLSDHTTTREAPEGWRFSKLQEQWLYDEVDMMNDHRGPFVHRILFSTGITLEIPFVSVIIHRFTVPAVTKVAKQKRMRRIRGETRRKETVYQTSCGRGAVPPEGQEGIF